MAEETRQQQIAARLKAATPGSWEIRPKRYHGDGETLVVTDVRGFSYVRVAVCDQPRGEIAGQADAELIANAPADLAYLLEDNRRLREALEPLSQCMRPIPGGTGGPAGGFRCGVCTGCHVRAALSREDGDGQ